MPPLRFPEFTGEWKHKTLGDISNNISSGRDKPQEGLFNLYGSTGIIGKTKIATYNGKILLIARVGANAGLLQLVQDKCGVTDNTLVVDVENEHEYLYYYLKHYNLNRLVFGSGQPSITGGMLKKICINFGSISERRKIAFFLYQQSFLMISQYLSLYNMKFLN